MRSCPFTPIRSLTRAIGLFALLGGAVACGEGAEIEGGLDARQLSSHVSVTPVVDLSGLSDWSDRIVIEQVSVNVEDVRLLGADPRIPSGGFALLEESGLLSEDSSSTRSVHLDYPEHLAASDDLAVFIRLGPTSELDGASVQLVGRLYAYGTKSSQAYQRKSADSASDGVDPDVDPAKPPSSDVDELEAGKTSDGFPSTADGVDPDVDPAKPTLGVDPDVDPAKPTIGVDPDVDPAKPSDDDEEEEGLTFASLLSASEVGVSGREGVLFVLRDTLPADMVATLGGTGGSDVVVGIPVSRWLTPATLERLDEVLREGSVEFTSEGYVPVVEIADDANGTPTASLHRDAYYLSSALQAAGATHLRAR